MARSTDVAGDHSCTSCWLRIWLSTSPGRADGAAQANLASARAGSRDAHFYSLAGGWGNRAGCGPRRRPSSGVRAPQRGGRYGASDPLLSRRWSLRRAPIRRTASVPSARRGRQRAVLNCNGSNDHLSLCIGGHPYAAGSARDWPGPSRKRSHRYVSYRGPPGTPFRRPLRPRTPAVMWAATTRSFGRFRPFGI